MRDRPSLRAKLLRGGAWLVLHAAILALFIEASGAAVWALRMVDETCLYTVPWRAVFDVVDRVYIVVFAVMAAALIVPIAAINRSWRDIVAERPRSVLGLVVLYALAGVLSCVGVIVVFNLELAPAADLKEDMKLVGGLLAIFGMLARRFWPVDETDEPRTGEAGDPG